MIAAVAIGCWAVAYLDGILPGLSSQVVRYATLGLALWFFIKAFRDNALWWSPKTLFGLGYLVFAVYYFVTAASGQ